MSECQNLAVQAVPYITLENILNGHAQICRCPCSHSPTRIKAGDRRVILAVSRFDVCG